MKTLVFRPLSSTSIDSAFWQRFLELLYETLFCNFLCCTADSGLATSLFPKSPWQTQSTARNLSAGPRLGFSLVGGCLEIDLWQVYAASGPYLVTNRKALTLHRQIIDHSNVPTHVVTLTQMGTSVYLGQTHLGTPFQVPAWVRKFSLGSTGDEISSLIIIQSLLVQKNFEYLKVGLCSFLLKDQMVVGVMVSNIFEIMFFLRLFYQYA